ncbi:MAG: YhcH/YjgK/YiaL family protein [Kiritimatiellia bacterium]
MIFDHIDNAARYESIGAGIAEAFRFLRAPGLETLASGRHEIGKNGLYAMVSEYATRPAEGARWEAHRRYTDIQYISSGSEAIGCQCVSRLKVVTPYEAEKDALFLEGTGSRLVLTPGFFAVFFPEDGHQPGLSATRPETVRKIVVKVPVK